MNRETTELSAQPIRLIALDLDGTLLKNDKTISPRCCAALAAAAARGVAVVPCSGRALECIPPFVLGLEGVRYAVASGGGAVYALPARQLACSPLPAAVVRRVIGCIRGLGGWCECYTGSGCYTEKAEIPVLTALLKGRNFSYFNRHPVENLPGWAAENAAQVVKLNLLFDRDETRARARQLLEQMPDVLLSCGGRVNLEVNAPGGGKGDALRSLGKELGIPPQAMMACGDELNDLSMLQTVGFPVAMGNAAPRVKAAAAFVTATNQEDGVASAVERFVLAGEPHPAFRR